MTESKVDLHRKRERDIMTERQRKEIEIMTERQTERETDIEKERDT
jgi:hypothetical protein